MQKVKITLEYQLIKCTATSIYYAVSSANGLGGWFADSVEINGDKYDFYWNKIPHRASVIMNKKNKFIRFQWEDEPNYYFEFTILQQELTGDTALIITDFADRMDYTDTVDLWNLQIRKLKRSIGCIKK